MPIIKSRNMFSHPIWPHSIYLIWQLERNLPLPSNTVAMAFVEAIQTLQLICEAWWELRTLKMQNRKSNSFRLSRTPVCLVLIFLYVDLFVASLTLLTFPNPKLIKLLYFCHSEAAEASWEKKRQRLDKYETQMRSRFSLWNSDEVA